MVLILDAISEHVKCSKISPFGEKKKNPICDYSRSNQLPLADQITEMAPYTCALISELPSIKFTLIFLNP